MTEDPCVGPWWHAELSILSYSHANSSLLPEEEVAQNQWYGSIPVLMYFLVTGQMAN